MSDSEAPMRADLYDDVIACLKFEKLTPSEQYVHLDRIAAFEREKFLSLLDAEHQRRKHRDNYFAVFAQQIRADFDTNTGTSDK